MIPQAFAARRSERLTAADDELRDLVERALADYATGAADWAAGIEEGATVLWLEMFQAEAPRADPDIWMPAFRKLIADSLAKTSQPDGAPAASQIERVTRWLSTMAVNSGTVTGAGARGVRFKSWVSMDDEAVRPEHRRVDGQVVPIGATFQVGGYALHYPGEPVGPPDNWINCRCFAQPAALRGDSAMSDTTNTIDMSRQEILRERLALVAAAIDVGDVAEVTKSEPQDPKTYTGMLVVLRPAAGDPVVAASSEPAHVTFVYLGEAADYDANTIAQISEEVEAYAATLDGPVTVPVSERGTLGDENADVAFLEPTDSLTALRDGFLAASPVTKEAMDSIDQFPTWTPHVTLGYPETPAAGEYSADAVELDALSLWVAGDQYDFPMGGAIDADMPEDDLEDDEEEVTEIPVHGVATVEGVMTGDGRGFKRGSLSFRSPGNGGSMPIRLETVGTHGGDTSNVVVVGRIDEMWRQEGDAMNEIRYRGAVSLVGAQGAFGAQAIDGIVNGTLTGVSIESDSLIVDPDHEAAQQDVIKRFTSAEDPVLTAEDKAIMTSTVFSEGRVCGFTIVPIPAFQEAYIALGHEFADEMTPEQLTAAASALEDCGCGSDDAVTAAAFAPGTKDGPGWITHPIPTSRIRRYWVRGKGAAKIGWGRGGDFYRCRRQLAKYVQNPDWLSGLCANMHKEATGIWPGQHDAHAARREALTASGAIPAPMVTIVASARETYPSAAFVRPPDEGYAYAMRIDRERRLVYGYAADWNTCHIGVQGTCTKPPRSSTDYRFFRKGIVETENGEQEVGLITMSIGHASVRATAASATAHYDQTDAVRAYINIGEDQHGIWYAGVLAPWVTDADIDAMLAIRRVSGDWRNWTGRPNELEMVGLVVVNTEGFQLAASGAAVVDGVQTAALGLDWIVEPVEGESGLVASADDEQDENDAFVARIAAKAIEMHEEGKRAEALRARLNDARTQDVRRRLSERV